MPQIEAGGEQARTGPPDGDRRGDSGIRLAAAGTRIRGEETGARIRVEETGARIRVEATAAPIRLSPRLSALGVSAAA